MTGGAAADGTAAGAENGGRDPWRPFTALAVGGAALLFAVLVAAVVVVDPYDTGRPGWTGARGTHEQYPYTANASRARDPRFDAAIFGNSHVQMLQPGRLDGLTGLSFVSLIMPATWPTDQLRLLGWMTRAHPRPIRALVFGIDDFWCGGADVKSQNFPAWLYGRSPFRYLAGLVRYRSLEASAARLRFLATGRGGARPDGYWDYGPEYARRGLADRETSHRFLARPNVPKLNQDGRYPGFPELRAALAGLDPETAVLLLRPPVYRTALPGAGSPEEADQARCGREIARLAEDRPRTAVLDLFRPGPMADNRDDWFDHSHFRDGLAREVERAVSTALAPLLAGRGAN